MIKQYKSIALFFIDSVILTIALILAYLFRFDFNLLNKINIQHAYFTFALLTCVYMSMFIVFKIHRIIWRYASLHEMIRISCSVMAGFFSSMIFSFLFFGFHYIPLSILPLHAFFYLGLLVLSRAIYRWICMDIHKLATSKKVLVIGAGQAADGIIRDMLHHKEKGYSPIGILDDNPAFSGRIVRGVRVYGKTTHLQQLLVQLQPDMVVFAIPSLENNQLLNNVYEVCDKNNIPLRVLPGLKHLIQGRVNIDTLKQVEIEDLLGREPVAIVNQELIKSLKDKVVLVSGAGGSIGSELCHQIASNRPKTLVLVDNSEFNLYKSHTELSTNYPALTIIHLLVDVSRRDEVEQCFKHFKPNIVFHAAAYKHVPMLEKQVFKAVKNNLFGSQVIADVSDSFAVEKFILVSTDKAVNPTNIMGMTKRLSEIYCQSKNKNSKTAFVTVRFGNVLGSNGSVLPLFKEQLNAGGPLTVTHPDMTRYFMMIPEAVTLILQSYLLGEGGEIFVLEMGKPIKIVDLAEKLIILSGQQPYKQVNIKFTGIRPGEKLFEEIFYDSEQLIKTDNKKILIANCRQYSYDQIQEVYNNLFKCYRNYDLQAMLENMMSLVPEYKGSYSGVHHENIALNMNVETIK